MDGFARLLRCGAVFLGMVSCVALADAVGTFVANANMDAGVRAYEQEHYADAINLLKPFAEQGNKDAQDLLGASYEEGKGNFAEAAIWYQKAADQGQPDALSRLGEMYEDGDGVAQNTQTAINYFMRASYLGNDNAQTDLGEIYANVLGDNAKAAQYFALAAESGNPQAQYHLGLLLLGEDGVTRDVTRAWMYLSLASVDIEDAAESRDVLQMEMNPEDVQHARGLLADWKLSHHPVTQISGAAAAQH